MSDSEHPALHAWNRLNGSNDRCASVTPLKEKRSRAVYRLEGVGPSDRAVVAKRATPDKMRVERSIYENILPHLGIRSAGYWGYWEDPGDGAGWIFLERLIGHGYDNSLPSHRIEAGRWLALLHSRGLAVANAESLPDRSPGHYLTKLRSGLERIEVSLSNPAIDPEDVDCLREILRRLGEVEESWSDVEAACGAMPWTVVHGDFASKNMLMEASGEIPSLVPFDWGSAGWGPAGVDLAQASGVQDRYWTTPDLSAYASAAPGALSPSTLRRAAAAGKIFRTLSVISGDSQTLSGPWPAKAMGKLRVYLQHLVDGIDSAGIT